MPNEQPFADDLRDDGHDAFDALLILVDYHEDIYIALDEVSLAYGADYDELLEEYDANTIDQGHQYEQ